MTPEQFAGRMAAAAADFSEGRELLRKVSLVAEAESKRNVRSGANRAVRTGNLANSIHSRVGGTSAYVGASAPYAKFVHDGTRYMRARPFIEDGIRVAIPEIERVAEQYGAQVFSKVGGG